MPTNSQTTAHKLFTGSHSIPYLTSGMDNVLASRLGRIAFEVGDLRNAQAGDSIDRGLILRRRLEEEGFLLSMKDE